MFAVVREFQEETQKVVFFLKCEEGTPTESKKASKSSFQKFFAQIEDSVNARLLKISEILKKNDKN